MRSSIRQLAWAAGMFLGCSDGTSPGHGFAGDYTLHVVHFSDTLPLPVPAIHVVGNDTTVVERGDLTFSGEDQCALELVYRWRYGGVPGGATVTDTLTYAYELTGSFGSHGPLQWFRLLREGVHIGYLLGRDGETVIVTDYDQSGDMDFYFQRYEEPRLHGRSSRTAPHQSQSGGPAGARPRGARGRWVAIAGSAHRPSR